MEGKPQLDWRRPALSSYSTAALVLAPNVVAKI